MMYRFSAKFIVLSIAFFSSLIKTLLKTKCSQFIGKKAKAQSYPKMAQLLIRGQSFGQGVSDFRIIIMDTIFLYHFREGEKSWIEGGERIQGVSGIRKKYIPHPQRREERLVHRWFQKDRS